MALHGGGHLELKKMHKGDFRGIFGICLGRCPCIIPEKISFLHFYSRFNPNALALKWQLVMWSMGEIGLPCTPPPPGQSETKFFCSLDAIKKNWDGLPVLNHFRNGRHCNLEITFSAITCFLRQLQSQFFGGEEFNYANKNVSVLWILYKQLIKRIFRASYSVIFVLVHGPERVTVYPPLIINLRPSVSAH